VKRYLVWKNRSLPTEKINVPISFDSLYCGLQSPRSCRRRIPVLYTLYSEFREDRTDSANDVLEQIPTSLQVAFIRDNTMLALHNKIDNASRSLCATGPTCKEISRNHSNRCQNQGHEYTYDNRLRIETG